MLSFKSLAVFATLAFGAVSSLAAPLLDNDNVAVNALVARCNCKPLSVIMDDLSVGIAVSVNELSKYYGIWGAQRV